MSGISVIRKAEQADYDAVQAAAMRFCDRHGISYDSPGDAEYAIHYEMDPMSAGHNQARIRKLWTACYCRALREPTDVRLTIAYGHVGIYLPN